MKTYLTLILMMISVCAWAMPSAKYIPADAIAVGTFYMPQQSFFVKGWDLMTDKLKGDFILAPVITSLKPYGVKNETIDEGFVVVVPCEEEELAYMILLEGTFDVDTVLAKIKQLSSKPNRYGATWVGGKVPDGGIYICSARIEKRMKALMTGQAEVVSPTSDFAKLVNEKNDLDRLAIRLLLKEKSLSFFDLAECSALKVSLIEHTPSVVSLDLTLNTETTTPLAQLDVGLKDAKKKLSLLSKRLPAIKRLVDEDHFTATIDLAKKHFTWTGSIAVEDLTPIHEALMSWIIGDINGW